LADSLDADNEQVHKGIGSDPHSGYSFLYAGTGYGSSCSPKGVQALVRTAVENRQQLEILQSMGSVNIRQEHVLVNKVLPHCRKNLWGRAFALWGLAFKPNADDMRPPPPAER
jgi:UDPglucose 6-dehydrogenase